MDILINKLLDNKVFVAALSLLGLYALYEIRAILMLLLIAFIFAVALHPFVRRLEALRLPTFAATLITAIVAFSFIGFLVYIIVEGLSGQFETLRGSLNDAVGTLPFLDSLPTSTVTPDSLVESLLQNTNQLITSVATTVVSVVAGLLTIIVVTIYWLIDFQKVKNYITSKFKDAKMARRKFDFVEKKLGAWVRGQLLISLVIGLLSFAAYQIIGLPAALALAIIAGFLEIIPTVGPILAAVPAVLIGFTVSPTIALVTLAANVVIQQLENQLIAPKIMQFTTDLHPIAVISVLYIGSEIAGLLGLLLAVPVTLLIIGIKKG